MSIFKWQFQYLQVSIIVTILSFTLSVQLQAHSRSAMSYLPDKAALWMQVNLNDANRQPYASMSVQGSTLEELTQKHLSIDLSHLRSVYVFVYPTHFAKELNSVSKKEQRDRSYVVLLQGQFEPKLWYRQRLNNKSSFQMESYRGVDYLVARSSKEDKQQKKTVFDQLRYTCILGKTLMIATLDKETCQQMIDWFLKSPNPTLSKSSVVRTNRWEQAVRNGALSGLITMQEALMGRKMIVEPMYDVISRLRWISFHYDEQQSESLQIILHANSDEEATKVARISKEFIVQYILPVVILASSDFTWLEVIEAVQVEQNAKQVSLTFEVNRQQLFQLFSQSASQ